MSILKNDYFDFMIKNFKLFPLMLFGTSILLVLCVLVIVPLARTRAAAITNVRDVLSTVKASTAANHEIFFVTPSGLPANTNFSLVFSGFDLTGLTYQDVDFSIGNSSNCSTATFYYADSLLSATETGYDYGVTIDSDSIDFVHTAGALPGVPAGLCVRFRIGTNAVDEFTGTHQIVNPAAGLRTISIDFDLDSGDTSVYIVDNDQVTVNATVAQTLTFSLSSTTIGFGALSATQVRFASNDSAGSNTPVTAHNLQASTNSAGGYVITVKGPTLTSGTSTIDAIGGTNTAIATGTEQFGVRYDASGGSGTVTVPYAASGFAYGADATTTSQIASSASASSNTTYNATYVANIAGLTEAGAYTTALTYVATASY